MRSIWNKWVNIGNSSNLTLQEQKRVKILNTVIALVTFALIILVGLDVAEGDLEGFIIGVVFILIFLFTTLLLHLKRLVAANFYFLSTFIIGLTLVICIQGKDLGGEFSYFTCSIFILIFFDRIQIRSFFFFLIFLGYFGSRWFLANIGAPLSHTTTAGTFNFMFFLNWSISIWITLLYLNENKAAHKTSLELLADVKKKNKELKQQKVEIQSQNTLLESTNKELERFAFIASHDLKTPLRNVNSFLQLLKRKLQKGSEQPQEVYEYLDFASDNARQMHYLITDILEYSQLNKQGGKIEEISLNQIIIQVKKNLHIFIEEKKAVIQSDNLPTIAGNISQLTLLFQNLIENGIKYNESTTPSIQISYEETANHYLISVEDNGIGIQADYSDKIFEMFTRLHNQDQYKGSGIGLATCQKIANQHGGHIKLESVKPNGSRFILHLSKDLAKAKQQHSPMLQDSLN